MPSWKSTNAVITEEKVPVKKIAFLPVLPYPCTEYSTVYTAMKDFVSLCNQLEQDKIPMHCDEKVYCIVKEIPMYCEEKVYCIVKEIPMHCEEKVYCIVKEIPMHCEEKVYCIVKEIPMHCEEKVYCIVKEIQFMRKEEFSSIIPCLGTFHTIKALMKSIKLRWKWGRICVTKCCRLWTYCYR